MIKITRNGIVLDYKFFIFPGGEAHIKLDIEDNLFRHTNGPVNIIARINYMDDFFAVALAKDALERMLGKCEINLYAFWMPYGQQDKVFVTGEPLSVKVFANLINSLKFSSVVLADSHNDISAAILDNVKVISQLDIIASFSKFICATRDAIFVSPDAGGNKKTAALCKFFQHSEFIRADKLRNLSTGQILETIVYADDLKGKNVVIADDIAKGSATFIELAKVLKTKNCGKIILYVTHGIFSKGTKIVYEGGIDEIYTTNSFYDVLPSGIDIPKENIFDLETFIH